MKEYIYSFGMTYERLNPFIREQDFPGKTYMLLENVTDMRFDFFTKDTIDFSAWDQGRIFNKDTELKWRVLHNIFRVVLITDQEDVTGYNHKKELPPAGEKLWFYLWGIEAHSKNKLLNGNFKEHHFIERSIPRILSYPIEQKPEQKARILLYIQPYHDESGTLWFYRFLNVEVTHGKE